MEVLGNKQGVNDEMKLQSMIMQLLKEEHLFSTRETLQVVRLAKNYFLVFVFTLCSCYAFAQKGTSLNGGSRDECFEVIKNHKEYVIRLGGIDYSHGEKAFICESDLPMEIEIAYKSNGNPVYGINWDWSDCECSYIENDTSKANFAIADFGGDKKLTFKVEFEEGSSDMDNYGKNVGLKLAVKLVEEIEIDIKKTYKNAYYAFDENKYISYPGFNSGVPWKFLLQPFKDSIYIKGHKNLIKQIPFYSSAADSIEYSSDKNVLQMEYIGLNTRDSLSTHWCGGMDSLMQIDLYPSQKILPLYIWTLRESDDDVLNYCPTNDSLKSDCMTYIESDTFQCILPGLDGTFDMYLAANQPWIDKTNDVINFDRTHLMQVMAGPDMTCQSKPMPTSNPLENGPTFSMIDLMNNTNAILNKGGIQMNFIDYGVIEGNFDLEEDDNEATYNEAQRFNLGQNLGPVINTYQRVYVFHDLKEGPLVPGTTTSILKGQSVSGSRLTTLDGNLMEERTLAHELGHSIWVLQHPDELTATNNPISIDNLNALVKTDSYNLMTSGSKGNKLVSKNYLRRYIWKRMQETH